MLEITSAQNPRIKELGRLNDRKGRDCLGKTLLEGYRLISRAYDAGFPIEECYFCPSLFLGKNEETLLDNLIKSGTRIIKVTDTILKKLAYRDRPEGLIAVSPTREHPLSGIPIVENGLYLIAEFIEKPGNLGSILRAADASGVNGVIVCDKCTDLYNPNVLTASTGAIFYMPVAVCSSEEALEWLEKNNITSIATTPHTELPYDEVDMTRSIAVIMGTEQYGLSDFWLNNSKIKTVIPMCGKIDSLNVAIATSIILFEASRQRRRLNA